MAAMIEIDLDTYETLLPVLEMLSIPSTPSKNGTTTQIALSVEWCREINPSHQPDPDFADLFLQYVQDAAHEAHKAPLN